MSVQAEPVARDPGLAFESPGGRWLLGVTVAGSGMAFLDGTVVNVALPDIGRDLGASTSALQWILNGYLLTLASLILLGGSLGDRYGRRRVFVLGVGVFTLASLLCAIAPSAELLIFARLLQGIGGALLTPGSLAIIEASFRPGDRARAIGAWSGLGGVATAIGPLLGGYLIGAISWRAIFLINLPIGAFVAWAAIRHAPESHDPLAAGGRLDLSGAVLAALGLAGTTYALIEAPEQGASAAILVTALGGILALVAFFVAERRSANPMLPLEIFRSRQFSAANGVTFVVYAALGGVFFLLVAFLQISLGYSPIAAGAASLPVTLLMLLFSARAGALAQRIGARTPLTLGPLIIAAGLLWMTRIEPGDSYVSAILPPILVFGAGLTLVVAPVTATVLAAADARHSGIASGVNNAVARVAGLLAVAVLPIVAGLTGDSFYDPEAMTDGFQMAMGVCAALAALGGLLAWLTISPEVLHAEAEPGGDTPERLAEDFSCGVGAPPLRPGREAECEPASAAGGSLATRR
ncbi:MAG TPA: DHA2 family efflux MFS transporter permease subunit [Solirubrobacterales bacterium]|nr:DHA2 family efflux MFS transporter permease subunit [Solirubrobacterales bacterium]